MRMAMAKRFQTMIMIAGVLCSALGALSLCAAPQIAAASERPPEKSGAIPLHVANPQQGGLPESWEKLGENWTLANVTQPTLTPFFPPEGKANGTAVIVAPGGGFMILSMESEGYAVAQWLADHGVTAFVLKYRLLPTPADPKARFAEMMRRIGTPEELPKLIAAGRVLAVEDAVAAMHLVRGQAAQWKIDPARIGFMGFSAGAFTTLGLVSKMDAAAMPNFIAPIYGPMWTPDQPLPDSLPPMWTSLASDDPLFGKSDLGLIKAWQDKGGAFELHFYEKGGHGYGFAGTKNTTTPLWPSQFQTWLESRGLMAAE